MNTRKLNERHSWMKIGTAIRQCIKCHIIKNISNSNNVYYYYPEMGSTILYQNPKCK